MTQPEVTPVLETTRLRPLLVDLRPHERSIISNRKWLKKAKFSDTASRVEACLHSTTALRLNCSWQNPAKGNRAKYRRFATAAEALRYAVEDLGTPKTFGAWLQIVDERFNSTEIERLCEGLHKTE
jgi:hypothetical protein